MRGQRFTDGAFEGLMPPGGYRRDERGVWVICCPNGLHGSLARHEVVEHEDGTITASPSILVTLAHRGLSYHGYLERGVWREC